MKRPRLDMELARHPIPPEPPRVFDTLLPKRLIRANLDVCGRKAGQIRCSCRSHVDADIVAPHAIPKQCAPAHLIGLAIPDAEALKLPCRQRVVAVVDHQRVQHLTKSSRPTAISGEQRNSSSRPCARGRPCHDDLGGIYSEFVRVGECLHQAGMAVFDRRGVGVHGCESMFHADANGVQLLGDLEGPGGVRKAISSDHSSAVDMVGTESP